MAVRMSASENARTSCRYASTSPHTSPWRISGNITSDPNPCVRSTDASAASRSGSASVSARGFPVSSTSAVCAGDGLPLSGAGGRGTAREGKPGPGAFAAPRRSSNARLEDAVLLVLPNAGTVVGDGVAHGAVGPADLDGHATGAVAARIFQYGLENSLRQVPLDADANRMCRPLDCKLEPARRRKTRTGLGGLRRDRVCIRRAVVRPGLVARSRDEGVDDACELLCPAAANLQRG